MNAEWAITDNGDGTFTITNRNSGLDMDDQWSGTANGTPVQQWPSNGTAAQKWRIPGFNAPSPPPPSSSQTMGETNVLGSDDSENANYVLAQQATLGQAGTLESLSFYVSQAAGSLVLGVYDASGPGNGPGTLIAQTAGFTPVVGWNTQSVAPVTLSAGTYRLG